MRLTTAGPPQLARSSSKRNHELISNVRLADVGRPADALPPIRRAVELTQRGPLMVGLLARALLIAGQRDEALALREELRARARTDYVGPAGLLMMIGLDLDDEAAMAALLEANVNAITARPRSPRRSRASSDRSSIIRVLAR